MVKWVVAVAGVMCAAALGCATGAEADGPTHGDASVFDTNTRNNSGDTSGGPLDVSYDLGIKDAHEGGIVTDSGEDTPGADVPSGCPSGTTKCGALCVDVSRDAKNCGACGKTCATGEICTSGTCMPECGSGTTKCGASCVDLTKDSANCGSCGRPCAAG